MAMERVTPVIAKTKQGRYSAALKSIQQDPTALEESMRLLDNAFGGVCLSQRESRILMGALLLSTGHDGAEHAISSERAFVRNGHRVVDRLMRSLPKKATAAEILFALSHVGLTIIETDEAITATEAQEHAT